MRAARLKETIIGGRPGGCFHEEGWEPPISDVNNLWPAGLGQRLAFDKSTTAVFDSLAIAQ